ncbi:hypothetical protein [Noviherbaspirillum autotrophicum]|uniref:Uncharacterized protein n=1 Tax=Noviherbaspirillum autotrophicum TaxID=709839 RepID=A0A0C1YAW5_9BURK|nr:hypothetical protein [Noviherbaspirillum autotrophicum]KIF81696.1 hypothetical protein TSA66_14300 [Noviherbaspirillum autotrophicum]KIF82063.1 hypothetical protein TSA66_16665 [Noviherbaspirillum autotrophicum]KIF84143.1 hypothetical protein TSA66_00355 [Noviherbaspirillum autotrophicum]
MKMLRILAVCLFACWISVAGAESWSQANYRACLADADNGYAPCRHDRHTGGVCRHEYRQEKNRCWAAFQEMGRGDPYYGSNGGAVRFEPVPIPQRPAYVLPGMK